MYIYIKYIPIKLLKCFQGSNLAKFLNNLTQKFNGLDLCDDVRSLEKTTRGSNYFLSLPANLG